MLMPAPDPAVIARREDIARALRASGPGEGVIVIAAALRASECDGLTA